MELKIFNLSIISLSIKYNSTFNNTDFYWSQLAFVKRHHVIRNLQFLLAVYGLLETIFYFGLSYNVIINVSQN